jgi:ABC-type uncharacterized transport system substrate-binding protein
LQEIADATRTINQKLFVAKASNDTDLDAAFFSFVREKVGAILVAADPFFDTRRNHLVALAALNRLPAIYHFREFAAAGGLISYGPRITDSYRQGGVYTGRMAPLLSPDTYAPNRYEPLRIASERSAADIPASCTTRLARLCPGTR